MSDIAIKVDQLSKLYRIGGRTRQKYKTLRDTIYETMTAPFRRSHPAMKKSFHGPEKGEHIFALNGVSLEVKRGEVVGIVGRNGAGKSTLLKVLSRITEPTSGCVDVYGRLGSLLEVGTGFHPELTGRENIFLNGAILGMKRVDIQRGFDSIVAFAELERFIDTPVKHYSSGMYMRLAFSVAAHLEPDVLLVDEVLAVGDAAFQRKCIGKMGDVAREGRTVIFVTHNMEAARGLCNRAIWLHSGTMAADGEINDIVDRYLNSVIMGSFNHLGKDRS